MSFVIDNTKEKIKQLEESLASADNGWRRDDIIKALDSYKKKLRVLETSDINKVAADMKIIMSHTKAIEDKYACRSVKFMFWLAELRIMPKGAANWIKEYTINKINAPVCSIVASPKPELAPMPGYMDPVASEREAQRKAEREELLKFRDITNRYLDAKPTRWEKTKFKIRTYVNKKLA